MTKKDGRHKFIDFGELISMDIKKPSNMLDEYFMMFDLDACKQILWIFLRESMTGEFPENTTSMERDRIFHFYGYTIALLEVMNNKYRKRQKQKLNTAE